MSKTTATDGDNITEVTNMINSDQVKNFQPNSDTNRYLFERLLQMARKSIPLYYVGSSVRYQWELAAGYMYEGFQNKAAFEAVLGYISCFNTVGLRPVHTTTPSPRVPQALSLIAHAIANVAAQSLKNSPEFAIYADHQAVLNQLNLYVQGLADQEIGLVELYD